MRERARFESPRFGLAGVASSLSVQTRDRPPLSLPTPPLAVACIRTDRGAWAEAAPIGGGGGWGHAAERRRARPPARSAPLPPPARQRDSPPDRAPPRLQPHHTLTVSGTHCRQKRQAHKQRETGARKRTKSDSERELGRSLFARAHAQATLLFLSPASFRPRWVPTPPSAPRGSSSPRTRTRYVVVLRRPRRVVALATAAARPPRPPLHS